MTAPSRFAVGDQVAEFSFGGLHDRVYLTTVERMTATQYVTARGNRYRIDTGRPVGSHYSGELLPVDDRRVRRTLAATALSNLRGDIDRKLKDLRLEGATAVLDEIAELVVKARVVVADAS